MDGRALRAVVVASVRLRRSVQINCLSLAKLNLSTWEFINSESEESLFAFEPTTTGAWRECTKELVLIGIRANGNGCAEKLD